MIKLMPGKSNAVLIPSRSTNRKPSKHGRHLYKARHPIESFFACLKHCHATCYSKKDRNFLGAIYLTVFMVWLACT